MFDLNFSSFPVLETPRLILRELVPTDAEAVFAFSGDPEVQKYDSDPPLNDIAAALETIAASNYRFINCLGITWGIELKAESRLVGAAAFFFESRLYYKADLGYSLARAYWRHGIMTETVHALMAFGFEQMRLHRINVDTRMDNIASVRLMAALGFTHEGVRRECILSADGTYQNWGLFGILENEYRGLNLSS